MTGSVLESVAKSDSSELKSGSVKLEAFKTRVDAIHIEGIDRTKDDILVSTVRQLFEANNFEEVIVRSHYVRKQLEGLGAFKNVNVFIDTSSGENASTDGLEVTYSVVENRRIVGGINTSVGNNNDGSLVLQLKLPNALGRGLTFFILIYF